VSPQTKIWTIKVRGLYRTDDWTSEYIDSLVPVLSDNMEKISCPIMHEPRVVVVVDDDDDDEVARVARVLVNRTSKDNRTLHFLVC
jgi:hypothetical protein